MILRLLLLIVVFFWANPVFAVQSIVINEIQTSSPQSVELYNNGTESMDISGWYIDDSGGSSYYQVPEFTVIQPRGCVSFTSNFGFNTATADAVRLFTAVAAPGATNAFLIDSFSYDKISDTSKNYQRIPDGSSIWVAAEPSLDALNLSGVTCRSPSPTPTPSPTRTPTPTRVPTFSPTPSPTATKIFISEILPHPETGKQEWVELYNDTEQSVTLENWYIDDTSDSGATPYRFSVFVPAKSYAVVDLAGAMFNNDGDTVRLLDQNEIQKDSLIYTELDKRYTLNRRSLSSPLFCFAQQSRGETNKPCIVTPTPSVQPVASAATDTPPSEQQKVKNVTPLSLQPKRVHITSDSAYISPAYPSSKRHENAPIVKEYNSTVSVKLKTFLWSIVLLLFFASLLTIGYIFFRIKSWYKNSIIGFPPQPAWLSSLSSPPGSESQYQKSTYGTLSSSSHSI